MATSLTKRVLDYLKENRISLQENPMSVPTWQDLGAPRVTPTGDGPNFSAAAAAVPKAPLRGPADKAEVDDIDGAHGERKVRPAPESDLEEEDEKAHEENERQRRKRSEADPIDKSITKGVVKEDAPKRDFAKEASDALFAGEELTEEFKKKAATIFNAAINEAIEIETKALQASLQEKYETDLKAEVAKIQEELENQVNSYLDYVAEQWVSENKLVVEKSVRADLTEDFIADLKQLFERHNIELPESKTDVVEELMARCADLEKKLDEQVALNMKTKLEIQEQNTEKVKKEVLETVLEGLAENQKDRIRSLAEKVKFEDEKSYRESLQTIREGYAPTTPKAQNLTEDTSAGEPAEEKPEVAPKPVSLAQAVINSLNRPRV